MTDKPRLHISDAVVARVAAYYAGQISGVLQLRPKLGGANLTHGMLSIATRLFPTRGIPTDGVTATVTENRTEINIALVTQCGHNCRDLAEQVQDHVAEQVQAYTGLPATVSITITNVDFDT